MVMTLLYWKLTNFSDHRLRRDLDCDTAQTAHKETTVIEGESSNEEMTP